MSGSPVGPATDASLVEVYVVRASSTAPDAIELLQLCRSRPPLVGSWQIVMGHIEPGETAVACAWRELREEIALAPSPQGQSHLRTLWALPSIRGFYLPSRDRVILPVPFLALVTPDFTPSLNDEHTAWRFVPVADALNPDSPAALPWPAQRESLREAINELLRRAHTDAARAREIPPPGSPPEAPSPSRPG